MVPEWLHQSKPHSITWIALWGKYITYLVGYCGLDWSIQGLRANLILRCAHHHLLQEGPKSQPVLQRLHRLHRFPMQPLPTLNEPTIKAHCPLIPTSEKSCSLLLWSSSEWNLPGFLCSGKPASSLPRKPVEGRRREAREIVRKQGSKEGSSNLSFPFSCASWILAELRASWSCSVPTRLEDKCNEPLIV